VLVPSDKPANADVPADPRQEFLQALRQLPAHRRATALRAAREAGWPLGELAAALDVCRQRIQQLILPARYTPSATPIPIPDPPVRRRPARIPQP